MSNNTPTIEANLHIRVEVECPHCEGDFDLMDHENLNEEGDIISQACPDGSWCAKHRDFEVQDVTCPLCHRSFHVEGLNW